MRNPLDYLFNRQKKTEEKLYPLTNLALEDGKRTSSATDASFYARKPFLKLEQLYYSDCLIFNIINTWVEMICSPGYRIECENEEARKLIDDWLEEIEFEDIKLPKIAQHKCVYGNAYSEIIYNTRSTDIVDLSDPLDPKLIDFKRDSRTHQPELDDYGNPVAYTQNLMTGKAVVIPSENMAHFKLYTLGASQLGIGIIEPIYWTSLGKRNIDEKVAQQEFRRATPFILGKIGDINHPPSAEEINKVHDALKNITYKTDFVGPYWYDVQIKEANASDTTLNSANYFVSQEIAGSGLPRAYAMGTGEAQNRATLDLIVSLTEKKVRRYQKEISNIMENKVFKKKCELHNLKEVPKMIWNESSQESLSNKVDRLVKEIQIGLLQPDDDLKSLIRKLEGLPVVVKTDEYLRGDKNATTKGPR